MPANGDLSGEHWLYFFGQGNFPSPLAPACLRFHGTFCKGKTISFDDEREQTPASPQVASSQCADGRCFCITLMAGKTIGNRVCRLKQGRRRA